MEHLPVEIVGGILSCIADARAVLLASATCRKWRQAFRDHLRVLSFRLKDWCGFRRLPGSEVEILVSRTILQTTSLQSLIIDIDRPFREFSISASAVMGWLRHTRKSLQVFHFDVCHTDLPLNVVEICGWGKLEKRTLRGGVVEGVNPDYHQFSSLESLSLNGCGISEPDLTALLSVCPNLESFELTDHHQQYLKVVAPPNIRRICFEDIYLDKLILESDGVEHLHLIMVTFGLFEFIGKDTLKNLRMVTSSVYDIDISGSAENLETIDINDVIIPHSKLNQLISESSKLQTLSLWDVINADGVEPTDLEFIATSCPQLSHLSLRGELSLRYHGGGLEEDVIYFPYCLGGSACFENVIYLKVRWSDTLGDKSLDLFFDLVEGLLERCPSLKKLVIPGGIMSDLKRAIPRFTTRFFRILSKCIDSKVQFDDFDE